MSPRDADPYAPIRPRWGTRVPWAMAVIVLAAFVTAAITIPGTEWMITDRIFLAGLGVVIAWFLTRFGRIEARPSSQGLLIRNLFTSHEVAWAQILHLQFGGGSPWASIDTDQAQTIAIMAIQKSDGAFATDQAGRLAALIEHHGTTSSG